MIAMESFFDPEKSGALDTQHLDHDLIEMASRAEVMLGQAVDAFVRLDADLAQRVIESDDEIDALDLDIEMRCLKLLSGSAAEGTDLRLIGTAIKMITDIERVADLATEIAMCALRIEAELGNPEVVDLPQIALQARLMFREAIEAFTKQDLELVTQVAKREETVDEMCGDIREQLFTHMQSNPDAVVSDTWTLMAVHHVERIADHALNIAERVALHITGDFPSSE